MLIALTIVVSLVCIASSLADWKKVPQVMESLQRLGVSPQIQQLLPILKTLGAAGLIIGLWVKPLGMLAAACLIAYFICAGWYHARAKDPIKEMAPVIVLTVLSAATLVARIAA